MTWKGLVGRMPPPEIDHPVFGHLVYSKHDGWINKAFVLWETADVDLQIDADQSGPSAQQVSAFERFHDARQQLLPRCLGDLEKTRWPSSTGPFQVFGLTIPRLDDSKTGRLWTLWFESVGDDSCWYGVQTDDDWRTIQAFVDD